MPGEHLDSVLLMEVGRGAVNLVATRALKAGPHIAKLMEEGGGANNLVALKAQRGRLISALLMEGVVVVVIQTALKQPVASQVCASDMVVERGAM